ncbi:hypothetical protein VE01_07612 [Pseudogymnoascus verrucosus]|uniref:FAD dependent oxidoreductase domain-containing protein n=1 Tax=Pseudogymnoascus verrucosus TaxID=342668 RepID=A0A1B8GH96_9PEZI|nr:uncharacterized protein VE01_07612 [Pseudogymnoascus verrucosus]OBT95180.1 hypothetical protein VE01_07612 [Pseudogymnoascus verrucosus]
MADGKQDIVIVGGGIIGCTTAYYLTKHPSFDPSRHSITLFEATRIGGGASGKAGGLLAQWAYPASIVPLSFDLHSQLAEAHDGVRQWGYRRINCGKLTAKDQKLSTSEAATSWTQLATWFPLGKRKYIKEENRDLPAKDFPDDLDWFNAKSIKSYEDISTTNATAQVNPLQFTMTMARLAEEGGVKVVLGSVDAIGYAPDDQQSPREQYVANEKAGGFIAGNAAREKRVQSVSYIDKATSESRSIPATIVVIAAGPWTPVLLPSAPISSLRAHSVTIRPTKPVSAYCLFTEIPVAPEDADGDGAEQGDPAVPREIAKVMCPEIYSRPNNEVYVCGSGDNVVPLPANTDAVEVSRQDCQNIIDAVASISDELGNGVVTSRRACYLPVMNVGGSGGPLIGETGVPGLLLAAGHSCWGIHNAPATGKLISEIIFDGEATSANIRSLDPRLVV